MRNFELKAFAELVFALVIGGGAVAAVGIIVAELVGWLLRDGWR